LSLQQRRQDQDLAVSPDGRFVFLTFWGAVAGRRRAFSYLYDGETGQLLREGEGRHWARPTISRDNRMAVTTLTPRGNVVPDAITIHRLPSLTPLLSFHAHERGVKSLAWSPSGDRLASGSDVTTPPREPEPIRVWSAATGEQLGGVVGEFEPVMYLDWHPSGSFFVTSSAKGTGEHGALVQILPAHGGEALFQHFAPNRVIITGTCFCPRTGRLAWHQQGRIFIYEIEGL
jgi:WD40 repeat protein